MQVLAERLSQSDCAQGFILDGVPRTLAQAEALEKTGLRFDHVISLEVADEDIAERMTGRRTCPDCGATYHVKSLPPKQEGICDSCGGKLVLRADDNLETVQHRLKEYHTQTEPLKDYYGERGLLREVPGNGNIDSITAAIMEALGL